MLNVVCAEGAFKLIILHVIMLTLNILNVIMLYVITVSVKAPTKDRRMKINVKKKLGMQQKT